MLQCVGDFMVKNATFRREICIYCVVSDKCPQGILFFQRSLPINVWADIMLPPNWHLVTDIVWGGGLFTRDNTVS